MHLRPGKTIWIFFLLLIGTLKAFSDNARTLVISSGGNIKLIVGLSMPIELPVTLNWIQNIQFQYQMIDNATQLSYLSLLRSSERLAVSRNTAYKVMANAWNGLGENGTACVLQMICDIAKFPLSHEGVLGEIIDTIFTPHKSTGSVYHEARKMGRLGSNCKRTYPYCEQNILDYFTRIH